MKEIKPGHFAIWRFFEILTVIFCVLVFSGNAAAIFSPYNGNDFSADPQKFEFEETNSVAFPASSDAFMPIPEQALMNRLLTGTYGGILKTSSSGGKAQQVPEPSTMMLIGIGLIVIAGFARKKLAARH